MCNGYNKKEHSEKTKPRHMSREANIKEFYTLPKSPKKSDVYRHIRDNENSKTTLSQLRHLSAMEKLTK
jgi:hypothetical protein